MSGAEAPARVASVSEIQAVLRAVRAGQFAGTAAPPAAAPGPPLEASHPVPAVPPPSPASPATAAVGLAGGGGGLWLLGTHGGSGVRCLSAVLPGTRSAGRAWPASSQTREPVVLVCRGNHRGLTAAQDYARAYRDEGLVERLQLLGVIVSADAPGRSPIALRRLERLLSGAVPILGHAPWEPSWRLGTAATLGEPVPWVTQLVQALSAAAGVSS